MTLKQILAALALIAALSQTRVIYPQALIADSLEETDSGAYVAVLHSWAGFVYTTATDLDDMVPGEMIAAIMYNNGTPDDVRDDIIIAMSYTGFFDERAAVTPKPSPEFVYY